MIKFVLPIHTDSVLFSYHSYEKLICMCTEKLGSVFETVTCVCACVYLCVTVCVCVMHVCVVCMLCCVCGIYMLTAHEVQGPILCICLANRPALYKRRYLK